MCQPRGITGSFTEAENLTVERVGRVRGDQPRGDPIKRIPRTKKRPWRHLGFPFRLRRGALGRRAGYCPPWERAKKGSRYILGIQQACEALADGSGQGPSGLYEKKGSLTWCCQGASGAVRELVVLSGS
jgi:hypothetical protein